ncbi:hypothetical protein ACVXHA_06255 [Escherichia coli]
MLTLIADFRKELDKRTIGPRGRQVLDHLMPHLLVMSVRVKTLPLRCRALPPCWWGLLPAPPIRIAQ